MVFPWTLSDTIETFEDQPFSSLSKLQDVDSLADLEALKQKPIIRLRKETVFVNEQITNKKQILDWIKDNPKKI